MKPNRYKTLVLAAAMMSPIAIVAALNGRSLRDNVAPTVIATPLEMRSSEKPMAPAVRRSAADIDARLFGYNDSYTSPGIVSFSLSGDYDGQTHVPNSPSLGRGGVYVDGSYYVCTSSAIYKYDTSDWSVTPESASFDKSTFEYPFELTYDVTTSTVYGCMQDPGWNQTYFFGTLDLETGKATKIGSVVRKIIGLAADINGDIYAIMKYDTEPANIYQSNVLTLYKIDKTNAAMTRIGNLGITSYYENFSATFDFKSGALIVCSDPTYSTSAVYSVNTSTGAATKIRDMAGEMMKSIFIPYVLTPADAPALLTDLSVSFTDARGNGHISFTAPTQTYSGETLSGKIGYRITDRDTELKSGEINPGEKADLAIADPNNGQRTLTVTLTNKASGSQSVNDIKTFVGADTPEAPAAITASADRNNVRVSWTAPAKGTHGGFVNTSALTYKVTLQPIGKVIADGITATEVTTELDLEGQKSLYAEVTASADAIESAVAASSRFIAGTPFNVPYSEDFANIENFYLYTIEDCNGDGHGWEYYTTYDGAYPQCNYSAENPKDEWLFTPTIHLLKDNLYTLSFRASNMMKSQPEKFEVKLGEAPRSSAMTTVLLEPGNIGNELSWTWFDYSITVVVDKDGDYNIGFHALSEANRHIIGLDDISIAGAPMASPAAASAMEIEPAPWGAHTATLKFRTPTKTVGGDPLDAISHADVYLNNVLYKTIDNPAPGTDVVVPLNTVDGTNSVTVYCFNGVGRGFPATVSVFTGKDSPAAPANFRATVGDEGVVLTWDTPLGAHGGTLDTEGFGYALGCYINGELSVLTNNLGAVNRFVDTARRDNQTSIMYAIAAFNETGDGPTALSNSVVTGGKPYALPFFETFPSGYSTYGVWENQSVNRGLSGWRIWNPEADTFRPFDDDQGALVFQAAKEGDECRLFSGNIDMRSSRHPVLSFRYRGVNSSQKLTVEASANSAEWQPVGEIVLNPADNEWHTAKISLNRFNETELFRIALHATAVDLTPIVVDCIEIRDVFTDDLGIAFSSRHNFYPGEPQTLTATVTNLGENNAEAWSVDFLRDGEVIATADGQALVPDQTAKLTTSVTVGLGDNDEAIYSARVNYNADRNPDNNLSDDIGVRHHLPLFPAPTDLSLTGKTDEGYSFAWNEPAPWTAPAPETVTDDFENYEPFIIDEIGDWTVVDENGAEGTFGLIGLHFPYREAAKSFQIFNLWALGIEMGDDEVTWRPHSGHQMLVAFADKDRHNDDWLISPVLSGDAQTISFWARSLNTFSYGPETYEVLASTTGNSLKDFSVIESGEVPGDWTEFKIDLPAGTTYFAIKCTSDDVWAMAVDDITYTPGTGMPANPQLTGYNLYRNNEPAGAAGTGNTAATLAGNATDSFAVTAVYAEGESRFSNIIVPGQTGLGSVSAGHKVTVSTRGLDIVIAGLGGRTANLYSADGRLYASTTAADRTTLTVGAPGVYIVAVDTDVVKIVVR